MQTNCCEETLQRVTTDIQGNSEPCMPSLHVPLAQLQAHIPYASISLGEHPKTLKPRCTIITSPGVLLLLTATTSDRLRSTALHCNYSSSPVTFPVHQHVAPCCSHSASPVAACCATSGLLWPTYRRSNWRHTGSSPGACTGQHTTQNRNKQSRHRHMRVCVSKVFVLEVLCHEQCSMRRRTCTVDFNTSNVHVA